MIKHIKSIKLRRSLPESYITIDTNRGARTEDIADRIKPVPRLFHPDKIIIHCGTNDLCENTPPSEIATQIINVGQSVKDDNNTVVISELVPRGDELNERAKQVNAELKAQCRTKEIPLISHNNIDPQRHLNLSKLHTNFEGTKILAKNFLDYFKN